MEQSFRASALAPRNNAGEREQLKGAKGDTSCESLSHLAMNEAGKLQLPKNLKGALTTNACA